MFRILIVDDEPTVVDAIAQTIPWSELEIEEVFTAYSAREALRIAECHFIDIVLTDIRMPGMDGMELMQRIRTISNRVRFIFLTGYAEFDYATQAIRLQAADYLLKPVRDEDLMDSIRRLTATMREEWLELSSQRRTMQYMQKHLPTLRSDLLRNVLEGRMPAEDMSARSSLLSLPFQEGDPVVMTVTRLEKHVKERSDRTLLEYAVMNVAEEVIGEAYHLWSCTDVHHFLVSVLKPKAPSSKESLMDMASRYLHQWQHLVQHHLKINLSIVFERCEWFPLDAPEVYQTAVQTLRRIIGDDAGLLVTSRQGNASVLQTASLLQAPPSISQLFAAGLWEEAEEKLLSVFIEAESKDLAVIHADFLAEIYHTVLSACFHYAHTNGKTISQVLKCEDDPSFYQAGELLQSMPLLKNWTLEVCRRLSEANRDEIYDEREMLISQIQEYIHVHLAEDVSLQALAQYVNLHPVYLSKVYKLVTGEGLKDYLARVRMERAMQLLKNSDTKIYEIAAQIGYLNTAYFIKVFKKTYGVTPQEYRDKIMAEGRAHT